MNEVVLAFHIHLSLCVQDCNTAVLVQIVCLHINMVNIVNKKIELGPLR